MPDEQRETIVAHLWGGLTFEQIGDFCGLHKVKVEAIADDDIKVPVRNPITDGYITQEDLDRAEHQERRARRRR